MKKALFFALAICTTASSLAFTTGFETNTLGAINGQASGGPNLWTSTPTSASVVNTGPAIGSQALEYTTSMAANAVNSHSWVDLHTSGTGIAIPGGILGGVSVYVDGSRPDDCAGLSLWANSGANSHSFMYISGGGFVFGRDGVGQPALNVFSGVFANVNAWNRIEFLVTQVDANTLKTNYFLNGVMLAQTHSRTIAGGNLVSDFDLVSVNIKQATSTVVSRYDNYSVEAVPEPVTLFGIGSLVASMTVLKSRKKNN